MKVISIPIVVGAFETVPKNLEKRQDELESRVRIETNQTTALVKSVWIFRRVREVWFDFFD